MITGGAKFFYPSMCLSVNGANATAADGNTTPNYMLDRNPFTYFYTVGSNDSTTHTITVTMSSSVTINRLFLIDHNWKQFTVKYLNNLGAWTDFTNVRGLDASLGSISETTFADSSAYYEFDSVTTSSIQITVTKTQIANQDKYCAQLVITSEIGTFAGYPVIKPITLDRNAKVQKTLSGKISTLKGDESAAFGFQFKSYPSAAAYNVDIDLVLTLQDLDTPFLVWLCGGRRGSTYYNYTLRGFRLKDLYLMAITQPLALSYTANVTKNSLNADLEIAESI